MFFYFNLIISVAVKFFRIILTTKAADLSNERLFVVKQYCAFWTHCVCFYSQWRYSVLVGRCVVPCSLSMVSWYDV